MLLFFATTATLINLNRANEQDNQWRFAWYAILLAMALTHYFGLIYAGLLLLVDILRVRNIKLFWERIILGGSMLIWPLIHFTFGSVSDKTGGNFWITSSGFETTVLTFAQALFPGFEKIFQKIFPVLPWGITWILIAITFLLLLVWSFYKATEPTTRKEILGLFGLVIAFVGIVAVIDRHTPISTQRNFIVLLPAITLLSANVFNTLWISYKHQWYKAILVFLISGYVLSSSYISLDRMQNRWEPRQNWKSLAEIVYVSEICDPHCWFVGNFKRAEIYTYYFSESMGNNPASVMKQISDLTVMPMENHLPIIAAHAKKSDREELEKYYSNWSCLEPLQSSRGSVFLLIPNISLAPKDLRSCP